MQRNILTIKEKTALSIEDQLLYQPYKNIIEKLYELATEQNSKQFDIISREFNGINNADTQFRYYYESLLGVTSYFQSAKGGRGKYLEKKLAAASDSCSINTKISDLPKLLLHADLVRKGQIFGRDTLSAKEKAILRLCKWDFIGQANPITDLCNYFEYTLKLLELKNRIDSGGTSARREVFDSKFKSILNLFITPQAIFKLDEQSYTLRDFCRYFKINKVQLALGLLFDTEGNYATQESDRRHGFYSESRSCLRRLIQYLRENNLEPRFDESRLTIYLTLDPDFEIEIKNVYGQEITQYLFHQDIDLAALIRNKYDVLWLFQLLAIDERHHLLKYRINVLGKLQEAFQANYQFRQTLDRFLRHPDNEAQILAPIIERVQIDAHLIPRHRDKKQYLIDNLYFLSANSI